jgi:ribose transport system substrate-binding protein
MSILEEFVKKDIPVLLLNQDVHFENKTTYIGTDNFELGKLAGNLLSSELQPEDKVAIITRDMTIPVFAERVKGAKLSLEAAGIKIVAEKTVLPNKPLQVRNAMTMILQNHSDLKGVLTTTDLLALSAQEVTQEQGYKIPVIGTDGITDMLELIKEEPLSATVAQNPYDMGYLSALTSMRVLKGEIVSKNINTGVDIMIQSNVKQRIEFQKKLLK